MVPYILTPNAEYRLDFLLSATWSRRNASDWGLGGFFGLNMTLSSWLISSSSNFESEATEIFLLRLPELQAPEPAEEEALHGKGSWLLQPLMLEASHESDFAHDACNLSQPAISLVGMLPLGSTRSKNSAEYPEYLSWASFEGNGTWVSALRLPLVLDGFGPTGLLSFLPEFILDSAAKKIKLIHHIFFHQTARLSKYMHTAYLVQNNSVTFFRM